MRCALNLDTLKTELRSDGDGESRDRGTINTRSVLHMAQDTSLVFRVVRVLMNECRDAGNGEYSHHQDQAKLTELLAHHSGIILRGMG